MGFTGLVPTRRSKQTKSRLPVKIINQEQFYSLPAAAEILGKSHMTIFRWVTHANAKKIPLKVIRDTTNGYYYVSVQSVRALAANRFQPVR